jgi:hypothetical protein
MPLVLAIKNKTNIVVATDAEGLAATAEPYGQLMPVSSRTVVLIAGNLEAVKHAVVDVAGPKIQRDASAASVAQLVQAALVLDVVPNLPKVKGRVEVIIAGIDPIRHQVDPGLYYMDSAQDFYLRVVTGDSIAAGSTAAAMPILGTQVFVNTAVDQLEAIAKECFAATKLRWPDAIATRVRMAVISENNIQIKDL